MLQQPIYVGGPLVAWAGASAHLMDMGGMVIGSFAPDATECYQEAFRMPPVRLFRAGEEVATCGTSYAPTSACELVEMDLRGLVAGAHMARGKLLGLAETMGPEQFLRGLSNLKELAEQEMRRRISALTDGVYRYITWTEWHGELFRVPCTLTVSGDSLAFDFTGAPPQTSHFFNSKPHIIEAQIVGDGSDVLAFDLPLTQGMFAPVTVNVPANSIVNSLPPAPVASAHIDVALNASMAAQQCIMLAMAASEPFDATHLLCGPVAPTAMGISLWSYTTPSGLPDGWMLLDGALAGSSAGYERDGTDMFTFMVARKPIIEAIDVEMLEWWYPVRTDYKKIRSGAFGQAGTGAARDATCSSARTARTSWWARSSRYARSSRSAGPRAGSRAPRRSSSCTTPRPGIRRSPARRAVSSSASRPRWSSASAPAAVTAIRSSETRTRSPARSGRAVSPRGRPGTSME